MRRAFFSLVALLALTTAAAAQLCGPTNPNCIVPNRPPGTNDQTAANTAFVQGAIGGSFLIVGTTPVTNGTLNGILYQGPGNILQNNGPLISAISNPTTNGQWSIGSTTVLGAILIGQGSTNDDTIENSLGNTVCAVPTGTTTFVCGVQQTSQGKLTLANTAAGAFASTLQSSNSATAAATYTLPTAPPVSNGQVLAATTAGVMSWTTASGGTPCTTTALSLQYNNAGAFGCVSKWTSDGNDIIGSTSARQQWNSDIFQFRDAAVGIVAFADGTTASGLRVYKTTDQNGTGSAPTNFERATFDWTTNANTLTIGTQLGGTGTARSILFTIPTTTPSFSVAWNDGTVPGFRLDAVQGLAQIYGTWSFAWGSGNAGGAGTQDTGLTRITAKVVGITDAAASPGLNGWLQWGGEARLDADFSATSNTTLANVTGSSRSLTVTLIAGRKYIFLISLPMVTGATAGGIKIGLGGTATITNLIADGMCIDGPTAVVIGTTQVSTLTQIVANTNAGTTPKCTIWGTFEVNAAGTFTTQFAQNASSATPSTVKRGAYMLMNDAP